MARDQPAVPMILFSVSVVGRATTRFDQPVVAVQVMTTTRRLAQRVITPANRATLMLPDLLHDFSREGLVTLGIDLGYVGLGVAQYDLRGLQSESASDFGSGGMPKLVRAPAVLCSPLGGEVLQPFPFDRL